MQSSESRKRTNNINRELLDGERLSLRRRTELIQHLRSWFGRYAVDVSYGENNNISVTVEPPVREMELRREVDDFFQNNPSDSLDAGIDSTMSTR